MKKHYTKRQIIEAIYYWQNQLIKGNYKKMNEATNDEYMPKTYFVQLFRCDKDGEILDDSTANTATDEINGETYGADALPSTFKTKAEAQRKAIRASKQCAAGMKKRLQDDWKEYPDSNGQVPPMEFDKAHCLAIVRQGDDWGSNVIACYIDGKLSAKQSIMRQLRGDQVYKDDMFNESKDEKSPSKADLTKKKDAAKAEAAKIKDPNGAKKFLEKYDDRIKKMSGKLKGDAKKNFDKIVKFVDDYANGKKKLNEKKDATDMLLKIVFGCAGVIAFMCSLNTIAWIILSPIVGPLLLGTVKRLSGLK